MAVFGIGCSFGTNNVLNLFHEESKMIIGYLPDDARSLHTMLARIKSGSIVYAKSYVPGKHLHIKAIGFVRNTAVTEVYDASKKLIGYGREVSWLSTKCFTPIDIPVSELDQKHNVYNNTLYEEYSEQVISVILDRLLSKTPMTV